MTAETIGGQGRRNDDADLAVSGSAIDQSWGAGTRTPNDSTRNCCVTNYTTPHGVTVTASRRPVRDEIVAASAREATQAVEPDDPTEGDPTGFTEFSAQFAAPGDDGSACR